MWPQQADRSKMAESVEKAGPSVENPKQPVYDNRGKCLLITKSVYM